MTSFAWKQLERVALDLLKEPTTEARLRSSINRSYYAAYGEAKEFAVRHGYSWNGKAGSHIQVWNFLRKGKGSSPAWERAAWKAIGDSGLQLKAERTVADYNSAVPATIVIARQVLTQSHTLIKRINGLP
jgi:hypothetical protein